MSVKQQHYKLKQHHVIFYGITTLLFFEPSLLVVLIIHLLLYPDNFLRCFIKTNFFTTGFVAELYIETSADGRSKCTICNNFFTQKCDTKRHILSKHSGIQQQVSCNFCGKTFKTKQSLGNHTRLVHSVYKNNTNNYLT